MDPTLFFCHQSLSNATSLWQWKTKHFFYFNDFACFINKETVQQHKLALVKKNTEAPIKVINSCNFPLRLVTHETKAFEVKC